VKSVVVFGPFQVLGLWLSGSRFAADYRRLGASSTLGLLYNVGDISSEGQCIATFIKTTFYDISIYMYIYISVYIICIS
jgi:hypothetical protein